MRIAYVTETFPPEINGVALTVERTLDHLRAVGHEVQLVRPCQPGEVALDHAQEWRTFGAPIPMYPELRYGLARVATLRRRWRMDGAAGGPGAPDLVHVTTPGPLAWAALRAARAEGLPTSADFRTNFHAYAGHYGLAWLGPVVLGYLRRLHAMADCNFVPTTALAAELGRAGFERLQVVGRGVDARRFAPAHRDLQLRHEWGADNLCPVALHVGRLAAEKNVQLALDAYEQLRTLRPGLRMVVVGDGPLRQALQAAHPEVHFAGMQRGPALARHYASADLFLFPSLTETFGNVTLEAMASGLAVAAFDTGAAGQHLRDGVSGCLATVQHGAADGRAFVQAAARALASWAPHSSMRRAAREAACQADWDSVLSGFEQKLRAVASAPRTVPERAALA